MTIEEIIGEAQDAVLKCDGQRAVEVARQALAAGLDPIVVLADGFSAGIRKVGDLFGRGEMFLPELIMAAGVMQEATGVFDDAIQSSGVDEKKKGRLLVATVEGDVHDIGKGIVISLVKTQGIEVIDMGRDVPVDKIIEKAIEVNADIIGTSALLTTTLPEQKKLEDELKKRGLRDRFKTIVGGAPATQRWADRIGADAYGEDASDAVNKCLALLERK